MRTDSKQTSRRVAKGIATPSPKSNTLPTSPKSVNSPVSTAASTPQISFKSPKSAKCSFTALDDLEPSFSLPESAFRHQDEATCTVCKGEDQQVMGKTIKVELYSCQNPHNSHTFFTCSQKCNKKFEKECARVGDAKRKQLYGKLPCPRCHHPMTSQGAEVVNPKSVLSLSPNGKNEGSPKVSQVAHQNVFLPSALLPRKAARQASLPAPNNMLDTSTVCAGDTSFRDPVEADASVEVPQAEIEEARAIMKKMDQEVAELEKQLEQLNGKEKKKERNSVNKSIFALKNSVKVTSAQRLLRDPAAESRRRQKEAETHKVTAMQDEQIREVVRASLQHAFEEGQGTRSNVSWKTLLKQAFAVGLTTDDEVVARAANILDVFEQGEREQTRRARLMELEAEERSIAKVFVQHRLTLSQRSMPTGKGKGKEKAFGKMRNFGNGFGKGGATSSNMQAHPKGMSKSKAQFRYKTNLCHAFQTGPCPYGIACTFAHGVDELRSQSRAAANIEDKKDELAEGPQ